MTRWEIEEPPVDDYVLDPPTPLAGLVYLLRELRRRRRVWIATGLIGLALAGVYTWHYPPKSEATVTLYLQHPSGADPMPAMQTDATILQTRAVAQRTIERLGLHTTPDDLLNTYAGTPVTENILTVSVKAASPQAALRTAEVLSQTYLAYRAHQMETSTDAQVAGVRNQVTTLHSQLAIAQKQYAEYSRGTSASDQALATTALQQQSSLRDQIGSLEAQVEAATDATGSVVEASTVLDPAALVPPAGPMSRIETFFTGGVGGLMAGCALVVVMALTTTRLRRREDIALAARAPVTHSVPHLGRGLHQSVSRVLNPTRATHELQVLARGLESVVEEPGVHRIALLALGNEPEGLLVAALAGSQLSSDRREVFLTDLSGTGRLEQLVRRVAGAAVRPTGAPRVYRPAGPPTLARGPLAGQRSTVLGPNDPQRALWEAAEVSITVAAVDLDLGLDHIAGWARTAVLLVTSGASSAEEIGTAAGLLRSAGVEVRSVLLIGADSGDHSFGRQPTGEEETATSTDEPGPEWSASDAGVAVPVSGTTGELKIRNHR